MADRPEDPAVRWLEEAERLIAEGKLRQGLKKLDDAAWNVRATTPDYEAVFERIRKAADAAARADNGRHGSRLPSGVA